MTIEEFIKATYDYKDGYCFRKRIVCNDGFSMSVQGSSGHYCSPRKTQDWYTSLEIGFPSKKEKLILEYAEEKERPTNTVYGYVPIEVIQQVIEKHKGINLNKTFTPSPSPHMGDKI